LKRLIFLLLIISQLILYGINIYINTYDNSIIIDKVIYPFQGKAEKFRGKIKMLFEGIDIPSSNIPNNLLVLEDGQTIGMQGTIKISEEVFKKLLELYQSNQIENIIIDYYPVEIFPNKVSVKDFINKDKLIEYLNIFLNNYELPETNIYYGDYDITPEKPKITLTTFVFPDFGYYHTSFHDKGKVLIKTYINGELSPNYGSLSPGTYTIFISAIDEIGLESTFTATISVPKSTIIIKNEYYELGSDSKYGKIDFVGNKNFYEITPYVATITSVIARDTTKPLIDINYENLFNGYSKIEVNVKDYSSVKTEILLNNKKIQNGIVKLQNGKNLILVYSEDGFGNFSFSLKKVYHYKNLQNGLVFYNDKLWINIGGIIVKSPYLKVWINPNQKRWIYDTETSIIKIFP